MKFLVGFLCLALLPFIAIANIRLPGVISSGMVLQQQSSVKLWGWSSAAEKIVVTTSWNNKGDTVVATMSSNTGKFS